MAMLILAFRQGMLYLREISTSVAGLYDDSLFSGDIFEFLNLKENISSANYETGVSPLKLSVDLENVSFTYPGSEIPALKRVSLTVKKGEIIAVVGHNGAGKSTLVKLLCRLYEAESGVIRYDGKDIRSLNPEEYKKNFSVIFQDFMLYNLPAGENIRLGNIHSEDGNKSIEEMAKLTGIHGLLSKLPSGYDTVIGNLFDHSRELSVGEWQKIALARALFRDSSILILDEPSGALDTDSEYEIFSKFRELVGDRTVILISHRFTNIKLADRIVVLEQGSVAEEGTHSELLKAKGLYYSMYTKQAGRFSDEK
jgi:ATP-binding cassette subfamily B protein